MNDETFLSYLSNSQFQLEKVIRCNEYSKKFGVILSNQDALLLLNSKINSLKEKERIELGDSILPKLIFTFCDSPYIYQDNYVETLEALQDIFFLYKNESLDELTDDELLEFMKFHFDGDCQGSLEYLEDTCLEKFARRIREGSNGIMEEEEGHDEFVEYEAYKEYEEFEE
jgi:hypothetical protein